MLCRTQLKNVKQIHATRTSFAALLGDGSVVTWGGAYGNFGGDSSDVQHQLKNVQRIQPLDTLLLPFLPKDPL